MPEIALFDKKYNCGAFDCGVPALNNYLKRQASQDIRNYYSVIFVALDEALDKVIGFYTLSNASVPLEEIPCDAHKKLPKYPSVPAVRLGRLAVDKSVQGRGVGKAMLADAVLRSMRFPAWAVMVVDAKDEQAAAFYEKYGFTAVDEDGLNLVVLRSALIKLKKDGKYARN